MKLLITGCAGFIGYHLSVKSILSGIEVIGIDNLNSYYDVNLKKARLKKIKEIAQKSNSIFKFYKINLESKNKLREIFLDNQVKYIVNLAAQAGVRYSLENPNAYISSNIEGFCNILECSKENEVQHLIYASSSSVYGGNKNIPFNETDSVDHPVSIYAATKKANELMAHTYSHLYGLPTTGLRFFTVYGPWGRPDMALFIFTKNIFENKPIKIFNNGLMSRDFTYIDDVIESILRLIKMPPKGNKVYLENKPDPSVSWAPYQIFNIGNSNQIPLMKYIEAIENEIGVKANKEYLPMQPGDVRDTSSNCYKLEKLVNFKPKTSIEEGIKNFIEWYRNFYEV